MEDNNLMESPLDEENPRGSRWHWFRLYCDIEEFTSILNLHTDVINHAHYILHDKDKAPDGKPIKSHIHCLLYLYDYKPSNTICKWFDENSGFYPCQIRDPPGLFRYLIHLGYSNKHLYDTDDVFHIGSPEQFYKALSQFDRKYDRAVSCLNDLLNGMSVYDVACKYGKDFIYHCKQYKDLLSMIGYQFHLPITDKYFKELEEDTDNVPF